MTLIQERKPVCRLERSLSSTTCVTPEESAGGPEESDTSDLEACIVAADTLLFLRTAVISVAIRSKQLSSRL